MSYPDYWPPVAVVALRAGVPEADVRAAGRIVAQERVPLSSVYLTRVRLIRARAESGPVTLADVADDLCESRAAHDMPEPNSIR